MALADEEVGVVLEKQAASTRVIYKVVRRHGDEEIELPALSLIFSGLAGGLDLRLNPGAGAAGDDADRCALAPADGLLCNTMSFLIMILRHLQFFTESTLSAVISVATHPTRSHVLR